MKYTCLKLVAIALFATTVQCEDYFKMSDTPIDKAEILYSINDTTVTSCHMKCGQEAKCDKIGLTETSDENLYTCYLLKKNDSCSQKMIQNEIIITKLENLIEEEHQLASPSKIGSDLIAGSHTFCNWEWKHYALVCHERKIERVVLPTVIKEFSKQFILHIEIKPTNYLDNIYAGVIQIGKGGYAGWGERIPYIIFRKANKGELATHFAINKDGNYAIFTGQLLPLNHWTTVEVRQIKDKDDYVFSVAINGTQYGSVINNNPTRFENITVQLGVRKISPVERLQPGFVRNFWIKFKN